jgi:hypothetical protein
MSGELDSAPERRPPAASAFLPKPFRLDEIAQALWQLASKADPSPSIL